MKRQRQRHKGQARRRNENMGRRMKSLLATSAVVTFILIFAVSAFAKEDRFAEASKDIATGITAVPRDIADAANESNIIEGVFVGTAKGLLDTGKFIGEGIFKILTFYKSE